LHTGENDEERGAGVWRFEEIVERRGSRSDQRSDALRMFGVGEAFEEPVGGLQNREGDFRTIDIGCKTFAMAFAGFAEEHGANGTTGTKRFFDKADTFDADGARLSGKAAAESHAEFLEPAIVAAGEVGGGVRRARIAPRFYG
jgi:hypothetical protein